MVSAFSRTEPLASEGHASKAFFSKFRRTSLSLEASACTDGSSGAIQEVNSISDASEEAAKDKTSCLINAEVFRSFLCNVSPLL